MSNLFEDKYDRFCRVSLFLTLNSEVKYKLKILQNYKCHEFGEAEDIKVWIKSVPSINPLWKGLWTSGKY